jgi:hypothetical protein
MKKLKSEKVTYLKNTGAVPAIFMIERPKDLSGLTIEPNAGIIPVGGIIKIKVGYVPQKIHKVEFSLKVRVRNGNKSEVRVGGHVQVIFLV